jgi:anti-anti-sigma regulatory factor
MECVRQKKPDQSFVFISGEITEKDSFDEKIGEVNSSLTLNCKGVTRINSVGVKSWISYFSRLRAQGIKISLEECCSQLVEQASMFQNFILNDEIRSLLVPLTCQKCGEQSMKLYSSEELRNRNYTIEPTSCHCGGSAEVDVTEDFFSVLERH